MLYDDNFNEFWRRDFRMTKETFLEIVRLVQPVLEKRDTKFRRAIPIEKRVALAVWRLAKRNSFRTTAKTSAFGKSTAVKITKEFCSEMMRMAHRYIKFPKATLETAESMEQFHISTQCKIPQVVGSLDGTHIRIAEPNTEGKADYFSRKQCYTISTQGVVGADLLFLYIATGFPGSSHDARNLRNTSLFRRAENREILSKPEDVIKNSHIRPLLLGDGAYLLLPWLITPFQFGPALTRPEKEFNRKLSSARSVVKRDFGILKARWRCQLKRLDNQIENVSAVIITCCVLHNFCQMRKGEYIDRDGVLDVIMRKERVRRQNRRQNHDANPDGDIVRTSLKRYVAE